MPEAAPSTLPQTPGIARRRVIRAIEDSFPIVEINRLAVPERNT